MKRNLCAVGLLAFGLFAWTSQARAEDDIVELKLTKSTEADHFTAEGDDNLEVFFRRKAFYGYRRYYGGYGYRYRSYYRSYYRPYYGGYRYYSYRSYYRPRYYSYRSYRYRPRYYAYYPRHYGGYSYGISYSTPVVSYSYYTAPIFGCSLKPVPKMPPASNGTKPATEPGTLPEPKKSTKPAPAPGGTYRYDGGPPKPVPMPKAGSAPKPAPATSPSVPVPPSGRLVSITKPSKSKWVYPAYGEKARRVPAKSPSTVARRSK